MAERRRPNGIVGRALDKLEETVGFSIVDSEYLRLQEAYSREAMILANDLEEIGYVSMNFMAGRPAEATAVSRRRWAQQARVVWLADPVAGAAVEMLNEFTFGRGVARPRFKDKQAQEIVDEAWDDPQNQRVLTSFLAQVRLGNSLSVQSNVFLLMFDDGDDGKVKLSFLNHDAVNNAMTDPENRQRVLFYTAAKSRQEWDFGTNSPKPVAANPRVYYYEAWAGLEEALRERGLPDDRVKEILDAYRSKGDSQSDEKDNQDKPQAQGVPYTVNGVDDLTLPPPQKLGDGKVYHLTDGNLDMEMIFGVPRMRRTMRWMSALNDFMKARVDMMQAAAAFVMTKKVTGSPAAMEKLASKAMRATSDLRAAVDETISPDGLKQGPRPGSILSSTGGVTFEPFNLKSGAGDAQTDGQMLRGQVSAGERWPQHYFGDASSANLACYDEQTETLTSEGWMGLEELAERAQGGTLPLIASMDYERGVIVYQEAQSLSDARAIGGRLALYDYEGEMVAFQNSRQDVVVTPNHRMYVAPMPRSRGSRVRSGAAVVDGETVTVIRADEIDTRTRYAMRVAAPMSGGVEVGEFVLPAYRKKVKRGAGAYQKPEFAERAREIRVLREEGLSYNAICGRVGCTISAVQRALDPIHGLATSYKEEPPLSFRMDAWLRWLGWYVSEGSCTARGTVAITQAVGSPGLEDVQAACRALGLRASERYRSSDQPHHQDMWLWSVTSMQLGDWLRRECGDAGAQTKKVPAFVFGLSRRQQMLVLRSLMFGDGATREWEKSGSSTYYTTSRQLADDVQRLALNCGYRSNVRPGYEASGKRAKLYRVTICAEKIRQGRGGESHGHAIQLAPPKRVTYAGPVYCLSLPSGTMVTRRNGIVAMHGNTATCHDDQTEALTREGWMGLDELKRRDADGSLPLVAAFDERTGELVYDRPKGGLKLYQHEGSMVRFKKSRTFDLLVTPNHRMLVKTTDGGYEEMLDCDWETRFAGDLLTEWRRTWSRTAAPLAGGCRVEEFVLPGCLMRDAGFESRATAEQRERNRLIRGLRETTSLSQRQIGERVGCSQQVVCDVLRKRRHRLPGEHEPVTVPMDAWLTWLGWYIAEGSGAGEITQSVDSPWLDEVKAACRGLGVAGIEKVKTIAGRQHWTWKPRGNPKQFKLWVEENVGTAAHNKRIPAFVFELPRDQQMHLLRGLMGGDGGTGGTSGWETSESSCYATTSAGLADDVQRLALHCGFRARKRLQSSYMTVRGAREAWVVSLCASRSARDGFDHAILPAAETVDYQGEVWCFSMPQDTLVTRRNGVVAIQRQSVELPVLKHVEARQELIEQVFRWFIDRVIEAAVDAGLLDPNAPGEPVSDTEATELLRTGQDDAEDALAREGALVETREMLWRINGRNEWRPTKVIARQDGSVEYLLQAPVSEAHEDKGVDEQETGRDLSYEFGMPSPLRRMMTDLVAAAVQTAQMADPNGLNIELTRVLLTVVLSEGFEMQDAADTVDRIFPKGYDPMAALQAAQGAQAGAGGAPPGRGGGQTNFFGPDATDLPADPSNAYGAPKRATSPEDVPGVQESEWLPLAETDEEWEEPPLVTIGRHGEPVLLRGKTRGGMRDGRVPMRTGGLVQSAGREFDRDVRGVTMDALAELDMQRIVPTNGDGKE